MAEHPAHCSKPEADVWGQQSIAHTNKHWLITFSIHKVNLPYIDPKPTAHVFSVRKLLSMWMIGENKCLSTSLFFSDARDSKLHVCFYILCKT